MGMGSMEIAQVTTSLTSEPKPVPQEVDSYIKPPTHMT